MKRSVKSLISYTMGATDGEIGKVKDFYFDDLTWTLRYLVVETGSWLNERKVLISPEAILKPNWEKEIFPVNLTKEQIKSSPDIDTEQPVSRQEEIKMYEYYPWTNYWGSGMWGDGTGTTGMLMPMPTLIGQPVPDKNDISGEGSESNPHLRSVKEVKGYSIHASNGKIGEVEDFIVNDVSWEIVFLVVDTGNWLPGKKVLISPKWIFGINWETNEVNIKALINDIQNSPEYDPDAPVSEVYESNLHDYYGKLVFHNQ